ncbi:hypothetical protein LZ31DRAFT_202686 [Colletotrichum somersetense]|nr:hypothetical protein LZ31DRAFT_202686 [Colletotrichum somersetense]
MGSGWWVPAICFTEVGTTTYVHSKYTFLARMLGWISNGRERGWDGMGWDGARCCFTSACSLALLSLPVLYQGMCCCYRHVARSLSVGSREPHPLGVGFILTYYLGCVCVCVCVLRCQWMAACRPSSDATQHARRVLLTALAWLLPLSRFDCCFV